MGIGDIFKSLDGDKLADDLRQELGKTAGFDSLDQQAWLHLQRSASATARPFNELFAEYGLSQPQYNILRIAAGHGPGGVPLSQVRDELISHGHDVTRLVRALHRRKLVRPERSKNDRRVVLIHLVEAGADLLTRLRPHVDALHCQTLGHMADEEKLLLCYLLRKARQPATSQ
jgi:DNA-binding MarR family transcriptional regulator